MITIKSVTSPLKGGVDCTIGKNTLLVGPNGSGKTSVLQAIKLATLGSVDDQDGSDDVKQTAAIARLFPPGVDLSSVVVFSNGSKSSWSSVRKGGKKPSFTRPVMGTVTGPDGGSAPTVVFPFQEYKGLLSSSAQTVRSWMEERVQGAWTHDMLLDLLPPNLVDTGKAVLRHLSPSSPLSLALQLKKSARSLRTGATRDEKVAAQMVNGAQIPLNEAEESRLKAEIESLSAEIKRHEESGAVSPASHATTKKSIAQLEVDLREQGQVLQALEAAQVDPDPVAAVAATMVKLIEAHSAALASIGVPPSEDCYLCLRGKGNIEAARQKWTALLPKSDGPDHASQLREARVRLDGLQKGLAQLQSWAALPVIDLQPLRDRLQTVTAQMVANNSVKTVWANAEAINHQVDYDRAVADGMTAVANVWEKQGNLLLRKSVAKYEAGVSAFLPDGESFKFDQTSGRFMLCKEGLERSSLSGAEMVRLLLALMAFEHGSSGDSTLYVLDAEDRGWDPDTLSSVMKAIAPVPAQVILMSTVGPRPHRAVDKDWTIISTGG